MNKQGFVDHFIQKKNPVKKSASAFAPTNIALVKYWGKRNAELNLPVTSSLSLTLSVGTHTTITPCESSHDVVVVNGKKAAQESSFFKRLSAYLDLFRPKDLFFHVDTKNDLPTGAGLASSASGFAALVLALQQLFGWDVDKKTLSMLARLGSGSSARSLYDGFVLWHKGVLDSGFDSFAEKLDVKWPTLRMGLWILSAKEKPIDSKNAMIQTVNTSLLYKAWPEQVTHDLEKMLKAIEDNDFTLLGKGAEHNALSMHATMLSSSPSICYFLPETIQAIQKISKLRSNGLEVYCTMDAGPNLKVLFLEKDLDAVKREIPELQVLDANYTSSVNSQEKIIEYFGKVAYEKDYDYKKSRRKTV